MNTQSTAQPRTRNMLGSVALVALSSVLTACAVNAQNEKSSFNQNTVPEAVRVPEGHYIFLETTGVGKITYECRTQKDSSSWAWTFVGPDAILLDRRGNQIGKYYGPPATWEGRDGSKVTATQVATAPAGTGNIPYQLVKANPAVGSGIMQGTTYIQRVATQGGVAPMDRCDAQTSGAKKIVDYRADYIFWKSK